MSTRSNPMIIVGYILGSVMVIFGILVLTGYFELRSDLDPSLGAIFGIVILLYGLYRIAITDTKRRKESREERPAEL